MALDKPSAVIRRKRKKHTRSTPQHIAENLLKGEFHAESPNEKWLTDVTEMNYGIVYVSKNR